MSHSANMVPLGKLGEIISGSTPSTDIKSYWNGDIPWITPADLTNHEGVYFKSSLRKITKAGYNNCSTRMLPPGSIIFSSRAPIGYCAVTAFPLCTNQGFKSIVPNENLNPVYGFFALTFFTPQIIARGRGATFLEVSKDIIEDFSIPLPSIPEQKRIAAVLESADRLRRMRRYAREISNTYLQSVFMEMFGDPLINPKGWSKLKAKDIFEIQLGKMLSEKNYTGKHLHPYLRNVNVQWGYTDLSDINEMDFDEKEYKKYELKKGDILVCEGGEVGRTAIYQGEIKGCCYQNALHRLRINNNVINREYFVQFMKAAAVFGLISKYSSQVTIAHFTAEKFKEFDILNPPLPLQEEYCEIVQKFKRMQSQQLEAERQAEHLFQTLLHKAFNG